MNAPLRQSTLPPLPHFKKTKEDQAFSKLDILLSLETSIRKVATLKELKYLLANETKKLINCKQVLLHRVSKQQKLDNIDTVSSLATLDEDAPLLVWLNKTICEHLNSKDSSSQIFKLPTETAPGGIYPFAYVLHVPFLDRDGVLLGAITFLNEMPFSEKELIYAERLAETASHAIAAFLPKGILKKNYLAKPVLIAALFIAFAMLFLPVPLTVLAPAEIVAHKPSIVTAPMGGVIETIKVQPNTFVEKGTLLFSFNKTDLQSSYSVAQRDVAIANARHQRAIQGSFKSEKSKRDLAVTKAEYQMAIAERDHAASKLNLADIIAKKSGVIVFGGKEKWLGKPVETGERIMRIADPNNIRMKIEVEATDAIILKSGSGVNLFLDSAPLSPISGYVETRSYEAVLSDQNSLVFTIMAKLEEFKKGNQPRIGLRGTAQIYGQKEPLWFYLFRKPISTLRQMVGF